MDAHPYAPKDLSLPGFAPNLLPATTILAVFAAATIIVVAVAWILPGLLSRATKLERLIICWWVFTALVHMVVEGYFVFSPEFFKDKSGCYLAEVWKEYSKGDSRYAARDSATVALEGITVILEGPFSLLAAYAIATKKSYSDVLQLSVSLGQLYGCVMYYGTAILQGDKFASSTYFYYAYYIGANAAWVVIPTIIFIRSWKRICESCKTESKNKKKTR